MRFLPVQIEAYSEAHCSPEPDHLNQLNRETHLKHLMPQMIAGPMQGRFLSLVSRMIKPKRVLEVGTYTGYSAICFAEGLEEGGEIITLDINAELKTTQDKYFQMSGYQDVIRPMVGNAREIIKTLEAPFDLVFLDADKAHYPEYLDLCAPLIPKGGFLLADNVLWSGKVVEGATDDETLGLIKFSKQLQEDPRFENVLLPIRDGLMLAQKV